MRPCPADTPTRVAQRASANHCSAGRVGQSLKPWDTTSTSGQGPAYDPPPQQDHLDSARNRREPRPGAVEDGDADDDIDQSGALDRFGTRLGQLPLYRRRGVCRARPGRALIPPVVDDREPADPAARQCLQRRALAMP
jgi:hypothetical protein